MTSKQPFQTHDDVTVEEASSLLTRGTTASPAPSSCSFGPKKTTVPTMRAKITTTACVFFGTLAVLYYGRGRMSSRYTRSGGFAADLLRGYNPSSDSAVFDPSMDFCFKDIADENKYCWYEIDRFPSPAGQWKGVSDRGDGDCGDRCTKFADGCCW